MVIWHCDVSSFDKTKRRQTQNKPNTYEQNNELHCTDIECKYLLARASVQCSAVTILLVSCVASILISASILPFPILIRWFSIFWFKHFNNSNTRGRYMVFGHKLSLKVCFRFIFGFNIVWKPKIPRIPKPSFLKN